MSEPKIRLIDKDSVLPPIEHLDWDLVGKGRPFYVARVPGYVHCIRGYGEPIDLWAWPRDEQPSYENMVEYDIDSLPVAWGLRYDVSRYVKCKWDDAMLRSGAGTTITRNGEDFYHVSGGMGYSVPKAMAIIEEIKDHPLGFGEIDYDKKMIGRKIWYRSQPGIITSFIKGQCCVMVAPDGMERFKRPAEYDGEDLFDDWYDEKELKLDCIRERNISWFRNGGGKG